MGGGVPQFQKFGKSSIKNSVPIAHRKFQHSIDINIQDSFLEPFKMHGNKAFRHVENLFIQRFLFFHPGFVFIVQGSLLVVQ